MFKSFQDYLNENTDNGTDDEKCKGKNPAKNDVTDIEESEKNKKADPSDKKKDTENCEDKGHDNGMNEGLNSNVNENVNDGSLDTLAFLVNRFETIRRRAQTSHWNLKGEDFITLHKAFGEVYDFAQESIDTLAERFIAISVGTPRTIRVDTNYIAYPTQDKLENINLMVEVLDSSDIQDKLSSLDPVSENILQEMIAAVDKHKWFIDSSR